MRSFANSWFGSPSLKIPVSVRDEWQSQSDLYLQMRSTVDQQMTALCDARWHYEGRLKSPESFAQKLETGRFADGVVQDFFACTIVVPNRAEVAEAERRVRSAMRVRERKPRTPGRTHKTPSDFPFDDLRLYAKLKKAISGAPRPFDEAIFEIQIKTFLQHAWSISTHDLVYKGDAVSWPMERVAYQVKAMLEHAEASIDGADGLSGTVGLTDARTAAVKSILEVIKSHWEDQALPRDKVRLARTVFDALEAIGVEAKELDDILNLERAAGRGSGLTHLSPYNAIVFAIWHQRTLLLSTFLSQPDAKFRLFVPRELRGLVPQLSQPGPRVTFESRSALA